MFGRIPLTGTQTPPWTRDPRKWVSARHGHARFLLPLSQTRNVSCHVVQWLRMNIHAAIKFKLGKTYAQYEEPTSVTNLQDALIREGMQYKHTPRYVGRLVGQRNSTHADVRKFGRNNAPKHKRTGDSDVGLPVATAPSTFGFAACFCPTGLGSRSPGRLALRLRLRRNALVYRSLPDQWRS